MNTINKITGEYLKVNGISAKFFAEYIGCELSTCYRWLKGERKLSTEQLQKTHEFLSGSFIKTVEDIIKEE